MNPTDQRNARPRFGSPLWWYMGAIIACATVVAAVTMAGLHRHGIGLLMSSPAFWLVATPLAVIALRPLVPAMRSGDPTFALVVFLFALLLRFGLAAAISLCVATMVLRGLFAKEAIHRNLFNAGQHVLTLFAAWGVLRAFSINPTARHPWSFHEPTTDVTELIAVAVAGCVYLAVDNWTVYVAISLIEHRSLFRIARDDRKHMAMVGLAMVSLSPLVLVVMVHLWPFVPLFYPALVSLYYNTTLSLAREHAALHDSLTGLANRDLLHRDASNALAELGRQDDGLAILVLDLDKFKDVNDTLGHAAGDQFLRVVAQRLLAAVRHEDIVARLGGDEFVVVVRDVPDCVAAYAAAQRVLQRVVGGCLIDGVSVDVVASVGVAVAPVHGFEFDALLRCADRAMYVAKTSGCGVATFDPDARERRRRPAVVLEPAASEAS
jgi:diguanylate cyclase (GGDEF)-like protein